jgi:hypothetical protein
VFQERHRRPAVGRGRAPSHPRRIRVCGSKGASRHVDLQEIGSEQGTICRSVIASSSRARKRRTRNRQFPRNRAIQLPPDLRLDAFCAAANTSRADVVPAMCSVPAIPRSIHPALTLSYISSAGPVWPFGMPIRSNASAHPARGTAKAFTSSLRTSPNCPATSSALTIEPSSMTRCAHQAGPVRSVATSAPMSSDATIVDFRFVGL